MFFGNSQIGRKPLTMEDINKGVEQKDAKSGEVGRDFESSDSPTLLDWILKKDVRDKLNKH